MCLILKYFFTGFGNTDITTPDMRAPSYLLHAEVNYVDPKTCTDIYTEGKPVNGDTFEDEPSIMCAGNPGKGICQGDSGGPLYDEENNVLVGVTSFSSNQCSELPSGFSNVASQVCERFLLTVFHFFSFFSNHSVSCLFLIVALDPRNNL